jgi:hypothetical protein
MASRTSQVGAAQIGRAQVGSGAGAISRAFTLSPNVVNVTGATHIIASGIATDWNASNPFSIVSGPATGLTNYANVNFVSASFDITVTALSGSIVISDGVTTFTISVATVPDPPTGPTITAGNGSITGTCTPPGNNGGSPITAYRMTLSTGESVVGSLPLTITGLSLGLARTAVFRAINSVGESNPSGSSNSATPTATISVAKRAPFVDTDTLGTAAVQAYQIVSGVISATGTPPTVNTVPNVTNGREASVSVSANATDRSFHGIVRWSTGGGSPQFFADELNIPPSAKNGSSQGTVSKICNLPPGTNVSGTVGYQIYDSALNAVGGHVTSGIVSLDSIGVTDGRCADITLPFGTYIIVWDNGSGAYSYDEVVIPQQPPGPIVGAARSVSVILTDENDNPLPSLTGLKVCWFDQAPPNANSIPSDVITGASTNVFGVLSVTSVSSSLPVGAIGWIEITNSDGTITQSPAAKIAAGPEVVS